MILWMSKRQQEAHDNMRHATKHQGCPGECAWGFSNPKHHPHSSGQGRPARRRRLAMGLKYRKIEKKEKA